MSQIIGIHELELRSQVERKKFEEFMLQEAFPAAAEVPGSVNRGGVSATKSQHLLRTDGKPKVYLWIVKSSGAMDEEFSALFEKLYNTVRQSLNALAARTSSRLLTVVGGFEVGPRNVSGVPKGKIRRPVTL